MATGFKHLGLAVLIMLICFASALAAHPDSKSETENIKTRIQTLDSTEKIPATLPEQTAADSNITFSGLLELEASYFKTEGAAETSDLTISTAELSTEIQLSEQISAHAILLWEGDDTVPPQADEVVVILNGRHKLFGQTPTFIGGKTYLPFGAYNSFMVTNPLTLDLGETNQTAALLSLQGELWTLRGGVFNGDIDPAGDADHIDNWVISLELNPAEWLTLGASYLSDLAESNADLVQEHSFYTSSVPAASGFISIQSRSLGFTGEYLAAVQKFDSALLVSGQDLSGERPQAWNFELVWMPKESLQLAARMERANDFKENLQRYGVAISYGLLENTVLAFEYLYGVPKQERTHTLTAQLAFEF